MPRDPATHVGATVTIDGTEVPCDPTSMAPGVLSGLKVTWGRTGRLDKPAATTCDFELVDPDGGAGYQDVVRYDSEVKVSARLPTGGGRLVFSGVVSDLEVTHDAAGDDAIIKVTCIDYTARLASINMGDQPWPQQSARARQQAISAAIPAGIDVSVPTTLLPDVTLAAMDVDNQSVAQVVEDFAWGLGLIPWPMTTIVAGTLTDLGAGYRFTSGAFTSSTTDSRANRREPTWGTATTNRVVCLDACDIGMDGTSFLGNPDDVTQPVRVTWGGNSEPTGTYVLEEGIAVQDMTRRFDVTSGVIESGARQVALNWYGQMAKWSQDFDAPWRGGALRLDPDTVTGIDNFDQAMRYLLDYAERINRTVLLQLLPAWTPWRDAADHTHEPNVLGRLQGGTYTFDEGRWVLDLQVSVERALVGALAPPVDLVVRPGDVVPYDHDDSSVIMAADPSEPWPVGAVATFNDGAYGWDGTTWVLGGTQAILVSPGDVVDVPSTDVRVRPSPTTPWAARTYATFTDGQYQWDGVGAWVAMVTVTQGQTVALAHDAPNVVADPTTSWPTNTYATFTDGDWRWNSTAWVQGAVVVVPFGVYDFPHDQAGIEANPDAAWPAQGTGERTVYGYATFSDGLWSYRGGGTWLQMTEVHPGDELRVNTTLPRRTDVGVPSTAWSGAEHADWIVAAPVSWYWNGNNAWDRWQLQPFEPWPGETYDVAHDDALVVSPGVPVAWPWDGTTSGTSAQFSDGVFSWRESTANPQGYWSQVYSFSTSTASQVPRWIPVSHDDAMVRAPAAAAAGVVALFSDGPYEVSGTAWVPTDRIGYDGATVPYAHDDATVVAIPVVPWPTTTEDARGHAIPYVTFTDGTYRWDGAAWVPYTP